MSSKCAPKGSVNSVRSVREKPSQRERKNPQQFVCVSSHSEGAFYPSHKNPKEQNTQG